MAHRTLAALCFAALTSASAVAQADVEMRFEDLPEPVQKTAQRETKGGTITEVERDEEAGQTVYEIEFILDGIAYELDITPDGTLLRRHRD